MKKFIELQIEVINTKKEEDKKYLLLFFCEKILAKLLFLRFI